MCANHSSVKLGYAKKNSPLTLNSSTERKNNQRNNNLKNSNLKRKQVNKSKLKSQKRNKNNKKMMFIPWSLLRNKRKAKTLLMSSLNQLSFLMISREISSMLRINLNH
jgi:preprotein translocase subunit SecD